MRKARSTTQEERIQIARECLASGKNYGAIALKHNVSYQQARTWTLRFEEIGEAGLEDRRGKRKRNQVPRTELEAAQIEITIMPKPMTIYFRAVNCCGVRFMPARESCPLRVSLAVSSRKTNLERA